MRRLIFVVAICLLVVRSPRADVPAGETTRARRYTAKERDHWSYRPVVRGRVPVFTQADDRRWIRTPIDAFVLARLQKNNLQPAPVANRRTLIRRLFYDLLGLPPSPTAIDGFLNDGSASAFEKLVDRLLADPRYGERWGQHWLDVVRFSESEGFEYDRHRAGAWRYRDYVVDAFNANKPYNRFVVEQLAGDEIETDDVAVRHEVLAAAGLHRLGAIRRNAGNSDVAFSRNEVLTEMTDMIGSAFLGMTLGCARCHDHKYDPISQKDYYRLQAFLASTHDRDILLADEQTQLQWKKKDDRIQAEIETVKKSLAAATGSARQQLQTQLAGIEYRRPKPLPTIFTVENDEKKRAPIHLLIRGNEKVKGERLGLRFPGVLIADDAAELPADTPRPKTKMSRWMVDPAHPLTARVMVNRIWHHHFGRGLVETPNDFGRNGSEPTHPQLLDWLAAEFTASGWDIKSLHRLILSSSTFRQSSKSPHVQRAAAIDAENRLLWRFSRRRLEAEEIRDSLLAISGRLNLSQGGASVMVPIDGELVNLLYKPSQWEVTPNEAAHRRRSIYLFAKRNLRLPFLEVFDQPDLQTSCPRRTAGTHAPQALELLNGRFSNDLAGHFESRLLREAGADHKRQIERAFLLATGRLPSAKERQLSLRFLETQTLREFALAVFNLNACLYVE